MKITIKQKLFKSRRTKKLDELRIIAGEIHNYCIRFISKHCGMFKTPPSKYDLQKVITQLKKLDKYKRWNILGSQAIQDVTDRIYKNEQAHQRRRGKKKKSSPPSCHRPDKHASITYKQAGYKLLEGNKIRIGDEIYSYFKSREVEGKVNTVTVKRDALGDYYIFITCTLPDPQPKDLLSGKSVGIDFGLKTFITLSNGKAHLSPYFLFWAMDQLRKASRQFSSKKKGSKNRNKCRLKKARIHKRATNARHDFFHKLARELAQMYTIICIEDLCIKGMQKLWGRKINDIAIASFVKVLEHHCVKAGTKLVKIDRYYPSSKQCSDCFEINKDLSLRDREWICSNCFSQHDRDVNAAKNIHRVGTSTLGLDDRRPIELAFAV